MRLELSWLAAHTRFSVTTRLLLALALVVVMVSTIYYVTAARYSRSAVERAVTREMEIAASVAATSISNWFDTRIALIETLNESVGKRPSGSAIGPVLRRAAVSRRFLVTYFGSQGDRGFAYDHFRQPLPPGYDPTTRPWYRQAVARRGTILTDPYLDVTIGSHVVTLATPLYRAGRLRGVTAGDFSIEAIDGMLRNASNRRTGYAFLASSNGTIFAHPDRRKVGTNVAATIGRRPDGSTATTRFTEGEEVKLVRFRKVPALPGADWYVGVVVPESAAYAEQGGARAEVLAATLILTIGGILVFAALLSRLLLGPIRRMTVTMSQVANGRYDAAIPYVTRSDEIGAMARAVEVFRANGLKIRALADREAEGLRQQAKDRAAMLERLRWAFGEVVEAAAAGDFGRRVTMRFEDRELNDLADSMNRLLDTIDRGVQATGRVLAALACTDLTVRNREALNGDLARLRDDTNAVADNLSAVVGELDDTSRHIRVSADGLLGQARQLSARSDRQQVSIEKTSTALQGLTSDVDQFARTAEEASVRVQEAASSTREGRIAITAATAAIGRMRESSAMISGVVDLIDNIAKQTALVALNASIEAMRSGNNGATFAVVATEIKSLARQAADASNDVKRLIASSIGHVEAGTGTVSEVNAKLGIVLGAVERNGELIESIAVACRQQVTSITDVSDTVREIETATADNVVLARDLEDSVGKTELLAARLELIVGRFRLGRDTASSPRLAA